LELHTQYPPFEAHGCDMVTKTKYLGEWLQKQNGGGGGLTWAETAYICFVTIIYIGNIDKQTAGR